jgi:hypothetical protein
MGGEELLERDDELGVLRTLVAQAARPACLRGLHIPHILNSHGYLSPVH